VTAVTAQSMIRTRPEARLIARPPARPAGRCSSRMRETPGGTPEASRNGRTRYPPDSASAWRRAANASGR
jgi:hypothetical protein